MNKNLDTEKVEKLKPSQVRKITPYLDVIKPRLTTKQLMFCWHYCKNGFNGRGACRLAGYKPSKKAKNTEDFILSQISRQNLNKPNILEAIKLILMNTVNIQKNTLESKLFENWVIQAFYDPQMFVNLDGTPAFKNWDEIPKKYHCCVRGIEKKYYGRNADREVIVIKLVDPQYALDKLDKYIQMTREPLDIDLNMKDDTLNKLGNILRGKKNE